MAEQEQPMSDAEGEAQARAKQQEYDNEETIPRDYIDLEQVKRNRRARLLGFKEQDILSLSTSPSEDQEAVLDELEKEQNYKDEAARKEAEAKAAEAEVQKAIRNEREQKSAKASQFRNKAIGGVAIATGAAALLRSAPNLLKTPTQSKEKIKSLYMGNAGSLASPGSPNLKRLGFQGKEAGFYTDTQAGAAEMPNVRAGGMNLPPQPVMVARQGVPPSPSNIPAGQALQMGGFKQPQQMTWTPKQSVAGPNMGNLRNPGNVFGNMKLSQAQGFGSQLRQGLQTRLPHPMAMPTLGRPTQNRPMPTPQGLTFNPPTEIESQLQPGEEVIERYQGKVKFWIGTKKGWESGDAVITQMETGAYRFVGIGDRTKSPRSKTIGKDLNNADLIARKGK